MIDSVQASAMMLDRWPRERTAMRRCSDGGEVVLCVVARRTVTFTKDIGRLVERFALNSEALSLRMPLSSLSPAIG